MRRLAQILALLPLAAFSAPRERLGFDPATNPAPAAAAYIAPENMILYRMRYPNGSYREFEHDFDRPDILRSTGGWRGRVRGERIFVKTGGNVEGGPAEIVFDKGRLVSFSQNGKKLEFPYDAPRPLASDVLPYYFGDEWMTSAAVKKAVKGKKSQVVDTKVMRVFRGKWKKSGRLRWPFPNPNENGCLYASLALLSCFLFFVRRRWIQVLGGALFLGFCAALVTTASRGSFLAFGLGLLPVIALKARKIARSKAVWVLIALVAVSAAGWFLTHDARLLTRGFKGGSSWSNEVRLEMWRSAPQMMAEAPGGWQFAHVGRAYMDWYQPLELVAMPGSLMNEHLTRLAGYGWIGRFCYLLAWLAGLGLLATVAWRTKNAVALGTWAMFAVAGWFNPVFSRPSLWIVPWAAAGICLAWRPWRGFRVLWGVAIFGVAALVSSAACFALHAAGSGAADRGYPVKVDGRRVCVKGANPRIWIVDDGKALGGVLACKEIRGWYAARPKSASVGYVRDVKDLPENVHRLVLAGQSGDDWLRHVSSSPEARSHLPKEVVFVSPPFPPSAVPPGLLASCKVTLAVGEFFARYEREYEKPPPWVVVVPGMELYLPGWMELALAP